MPESYIDGFILDLFGADEGSETSTQTVLDSTTRPS
jgi:hypothetical protein